MYRTHPLNTWASNLANMVISFAILFFSSQALDLSDFGVRSLRTKLLLIFNVQFRVSLPADGNSLDPLKLKVKVINLIYLSAALHQFSVESFYFY